jgi:FAD/FMN-containing dehydrogenase
MPTLENWNKSARSTPQTVAVPASVAELQAIVADRAGHPDPVRAAGYLHSVNECFAADRGGQGGTQVFMRHFDHVNVDATAVPPTITAGAGVTLLQIREALRPHGLELALMPEIGNATAGSVACAGTKDSWMFAGPPTAAGWPADQQAGFAQISSLVRSVRVVRADGSDVHVTDPAELHVLRSSYGLMGIVHEVTFEARKAEILRSVYHWERDVSPTHVPPLDEVFGGANAVLAFLQPYSGRLLVERRFRDPGGTIGALDELKRGVRDALWEWGASESTTFATGLRAILTDPDRENLILSLLGAIPASRSARIGVSGFAVDLLKPAVRKILAAIPAAALPEPDAPLSTWLLSVFDGSVVPLFKALGDFRGYRGDSMINFEGDRPSYFDFTFWAFPVSGWQRTVQDYIAFCRQHESGALLPRFRSRLFTEIYFMGRDRQALLSFAPDEPVFTLDMVDTYRKEDHARRSDWHAMSQAYNQWAATHGGRPVFNQTKQIDKTPAVVQAPAPIAGAWAQFRQAVAAADPGGRFRNGFFHALL